MNKQAKNECGFNLFLRCFYCCYVISHRQKHLLGCKIEFSFAARRVSLTRLLAHVGWRFFFAISLVFRTFNNLGNHSGPNDKQLNDIYFLRSCI